ncbi:MAG: c-type cytochrome [Anaerolineae bacterium]|nr:c-type cytochrome [Anaerolineae bacterium]
MNTLTKLLFGVGALLIASALALAWNSGPAHSAQDVTPTPGGPSPATQMTVIIQDQTFTPHTIIVATGATITWENRDVAAHTVHSDAGWFESGSLEPGDTFVWQPDQPGTFTYNCTIHPGMEGVIIVLPGGAVAPLPFDGQPVEQVYRDSCSGCHGPNREGATGVALIPGRLAENDEFYFNVIQGGVPGTVMPAWGALGLSDEEIWSLVGYIRSEPDAEEIEWEMGDIAASHTELVPESDLPDAPIHDGNMDNLLLVTEREARSIAVFDGDSHTLLGHIDASYRAHGYAFDPTSDRWAYNVGRDGWLFKIDLYSLQGVAKVRVGLDSRGLAISDDGQYVIVGNYIPATAVILDAQTLQPLQVIHTDTETAEGEIIHSRVAITSDVAPSLVGPYFLIGLKEGGEVWRIDYSQPDFPVEKAADVGGILHDGFLSPDNTRFYIASQRNDWMAVIDVESMAVVERIETGSTPHPGSGATWEANGTQYGATVHAGEGKITVWDLSDNAIVAEIPTSGPGLFIRAHPDNPYVWADTMFAEQPNRIYVFDKETFEVVHVIEEGIQPLHPELTLDGEYVYVSDWQGNVVRVYDALTFEKVAEIGDVITPTGIFHVERRLETLGH